VPGGGALGDVVAAVTPGQPLQLPLDVHLGGVEVGELPAQPERFALAQAAGQARRPP
jgi:hypothetical protein